MSTHSGKFWIETNKRHTILFWCVLVRRGGRGERGWGRGWGRGGRGGRGWGRGQERGRGSGGGISKEPSRMIAKLLLARFTFWRKKNWLPTDQQTDRRTNRPTNHWRMDKPSYRDVWTPFLLKRRELDQHEYGEKGRFADFRNCFNKCHPRPFPKKLWVRFFVSKFSRALNIMLGH